MILLLVVKIRKTMIFLKCLILTYLKKLPLIKEEKN